MTDTEKFEVFEKSFFGSSLRFSSCDPQEIATWLMANKGYNQQPTMDAGFYLILPNRQGRILGGPSLDKWIKTYI